MDFCRTVLPFLNWGKKTHNFKYNWFFALSALAFFCIEAQPDKMYLIGIPLAFLCALFIAAKAPNLPRWLWDRNKPFLAFAALSAAGICWSSQEQFFRGLSNSPYLQTIQERIPLQADLPLVLSLIGGIGSLPFLLVCLVFFWERLQRALRSTSLLSDLQKGEAVFYLVLFLIAATLTSAAFLKTDAFYGTGFPEAVIHTSDSPMLVKSNAYMRLAYGENDLRQPLFAVFAAPFLGFFYFFGKLFSVSPAVRAILMNLPQLVLLIASGYMIGKLFRFSPVERVSLVLVLAAAYPGLLFSLMMEQYIVATFWLILSFYLISEKGKTGFFPYWGCCSTLLTGAVLLPFVSDEDIRTSWKERLKKCLYAVLGFALLLIVFCRFDVIATAYSKFVFLLQFSGKPVPFGERVLQFFDFLRSCFLAPYAEPRCYYGDYYAWRVPQITALSGIGIAVAILAAAGFVINRKRKEVTLAALWAVFAVAVLLVFGWGAMENGLLLYALYFGWPFQVLIFLLLQNLGSLIHFRHTVPIASVICAAALLAYNLPALWSMMEFALTYYPI